ncbi:MAG: aminotransferase class V-fold PLP-dependent enzyme [Bacteroidales bacterium]|nr:aminotransferase class V-fold PLP-dependent enzyme [Bacteroidales bacterium]
MNELAPHFSRFRKLTIGNDLYFETPYGKKKMIYADWVASGRLYAPIEEKLTKAIGPFVGNTHTETTESGMLMTKAYQYAHQKIKEHVNADENDAIITAGFGMTAVINKFQRILGFKTCAEVKDGKCVPRKEKPVVFITHMEHHSNQTSWLETYCDVVLLKPDEKNLVRPDSLREEIVKYKDRELKIGAFTACSNVTGVIPDFYELAGIMHANGGIIILDFAGSAPYVDIDMHPGDPMKKLDAIVFSPHKFLGGPGSSGVLIFNKDLYHSEVPDHPGGGTVDWTDPWGGYKYIDDIEIREDGGTPGFLQAMRAALAIEVKEQMKPALMWEREHQLVKRAFEGFGEIKGMHILADNVKDRLGIFSFWFEDIHFNLIGKLLNDRYGVQVRGGCACAGTYGHFLLNVSPEESKRITDKINSGDLSEKPGFVRVSLHPTMTDEELEIIIAAMGEIAENHKEWEKDYVYSSETNEFYHKNEMDKSGRVQQWFRFDDEA